MGRAHQGFHHGDLSRALVEVSLGMAREDGASAVVLREATRRVGVTPRAAYRHFEDREMLVAAVADEALARLSAVLLVAAKDQLRARARLSAVGQAYIRFALDEPGLFDVAMLSVADMRPGRLCVSSAQAPFKVLLDAVEHFVAEGAVTAEEVLEVANLCWSTVHGFACLAVKGPLRSFPRPELDRMAAATVTRVLRAVDGYDV